MIYRNLGRTGIKVRTGRRGFVMWGGVCERGEATRWPGGWVGGWGGARRGAASPPPLSPSISLFHPHQVSVLSYGAWVTFGSQVGVEAAKKLMQQARDAGVNL